MESSNNTTTKSQATKNNSIINKIFDNDYLESLEYVYKIIIRRDDVKNAQILLTVLKEATLARKVELESNKEIKDFYKKVIIRLGFIALPLLDDKDAIDLLANNFTRQFNLSDYDISEKLSAKLINILILEDRDKFKASLKAALLVNKEVITKNAEIKIVADWLKNYNSKLGLGAANNLALTQYFVDLSKIKGLDERDMNRLKVLFNFYESLKLSSLTPEGFDETIPMTIDNKLYIFRRGVLEPVGKIAIKQKATEEKEISKIGNIPKGIGANKAINDLEELKQLSATYPNGSFERKAVEEEIDRLTNLKK